MVCGPIVGVPHRVINKSKIPHNGGCIFILWRRWKCRCVSMNICRRFVIILMLTLCGNVTHLVAYLALSAGILITWPWSVGWSPRTTSKSLCAISELSSVVAVERATTSLERSLIFVPVVKISGCRDVCLKKRWIIEFMFLEVFFLRKQKSFDIFDVIQVKARSNRGNERIVIFR